MHLLFSSYPIIFRNTFTLETIYFINSKPDLAFKFRCCEFGFIKQIWKLNITLYHGIKREGKFKIIVFEPQTRYLLEIWKCHEKNRRKNQQKKSGRKTSICRKCDINCATRGITYDTNYDATPEFGPFFCRISTVITVVSVSFLYLRFP